MTEVWKSVPKKFCEICKCWYYDNKISVQHHEQGRRHQENVKNKLRDLGRKGREQEHEQRAKFNALMQMERGAMAAYRKDLKDAASAAAAYNMTLAGLGGSSSAAKRPRLEGAASEYPSTSGIAEVVWYETKTTDESGNELSYYWNIQTGETLWELPAGQSFVSLVQERIAAPESSAAKQEVADESDSEHETQAATRKAGEKKTGKGRPEAKSAGKKPLAKPKKETNGASRAAISIGSSKQDAPEKSGASAAVADKVLPKFEEDEASRGKPFGDWQPVEVVKPRKNEFTYLPHNQWAKESAPAEAQIDLSALEEDPKEKITFAERTAPSLPSTSASSASCSFKKRKAPTAGRNIRNRDD